MNNLLEWEKFQEILINIIETLSLFLDLLLLKEKSTLFKGTSKISFIILIEKNMR